MTLTATPLVGSGHANEVVLKRLGAVAVQASRLERLAGEIAADLKLSGEDGCIGMMRDGSFTTPPWASTSSKDVVAWATATTRLLSTRASIFAASGGARFTGSRGDTIATESLDGSVFPADEEYLTRFLKRLERHFAAGLELHEGLDYRDEKGQRWPLVSIYRKAHAEQTATSDNLRLPADWERWLSA
jgi:hypothetical protein